MIIFGNSKEYVRKSEKLKNSECPYCKNINTMNADVLMRYFHIWFIPFFPTGKRIIASCEHCKASYKSTDLSGYISQQCNEIRKTTKYPLKYWSWLLILATAILFVIVLGLSSQPKK